MILDISAVKSIMVAKSKNRFNRYIKACSGDIEKAFRLYTWNGAIGAAFHVPIQAVEIVLRTTIHNSLASHYGSNWYDNCESIVDEVAFKKIQDAKDKSNYDPKHSEHLVTKLSFGFWVSLLGSGGPLLKSGHANYEITLWRPALMRAFPINLTRKNVHFQIDKIRRLRNKIVHHEAVFSRRLEDDYEGILTVLEWLSPETRNWIASFSTIPTLLVTKSDTTIIRF